MCSLYFSVLIIIIFHAGQVISSYHARSSTFIPRLVEVEKSLLDPLLEYRGHLKERLNILNEYIEDYERNAEYTDVLGNPIATYALLIRRFPYFLERIKKNIEVGMESEIVAKLTPQDQALSWPDKDDHFRAMEALLTIQDIYDLSARDIANGIIQGKPTNTHLDLSHTLSLAMYSLRLEKFTMAKEWIDLSEELGDGPTNQTAQWREQLIQKHDLAFQKGLKDKDKLHRFTAPLASASKDPKPYRKGEAQRWLNSREKVVFDDKTDAEWLVKHYRKLELCHGRDFQDPKVRAQLRCRYEWKKTPFGPVGPLKVEEVSRNPEITIFREFLGPKMCKEIRDKGTPKLELEKMSIAEERTGETIVLGMTWLDPTDPLELKLIRLTELATGLSVGRESGEESRIGLYAFGADMLCHHDAQRIGSYSTGIVQEYGDRLATVLTYISDVELGGHTVFPVIGVHLKPQLGDALLYYNMKRNGDLDDGALHGACPVLLGTKWHSTKWIRTKGNMKQRPCALDPHL